MSAQFLTIAGRWKQHVEASKIDQTLPRREQALAMLMFYAGFSAALDATLETANFPEEEAMQLMQAMHTETEQVAAMAGHMFSGARPQ